MPARAIEYPLAIKEKKMKANEYTDITFTIEDRVARIVINRPEKLNAIRIRTYRELIHALEYADGSEECGVIAVEGAGGQFTAGNDLEDLVSGNMEELVDCVQSIFTTIAGVKKVVVAAVEGVAVGIGTTLLLHCDIVVASSKAKFRVPFVNLGVAPEGGSSVLMPETFGQKAARDILLTGRFFSAEEAHSWGLVSAVADAGGTGNVAQGYIETLLKQPLPSLLKTKELMRNSLPDVGELVARELASFGALLQTEETQARITAMVNR